MKGATYVPSLLNEGAAGRSDGTFAVDGSDYYYFRELFLHDVGHCVEVEFNADYSEDAANAYANMVVAELS